MPNNHTDGNKQLHTIIHKALLYIKVKSSLLLERSVGSFVEISSLFFFASFNK